MGSAMCCGRKGRVSNRRLEVMCGFAKMNCRCRLTLNHERLCGVVRVWAGRIPCGTGIPPKGR